MDSREDVGSVIFLLSLKLILITSLRLREKMNMKEKSSYDSSIKTSSDPIKQEILKLILVIVTN